MSTVYDDALDIVVARLSGSPALTANVRRTHRVTVPREDSDALYVVEDDDKPGKSHGDCTTEHESGFVVRVLIRMDDYVDRAAELKEGVMQRLNPTAAGMPAYPTGVVIEPRAIRMDTESADQDVTRIDMAFWLKYQSAYWSLEAEA